MMIRRSRRFEAPLPGPSRLLRYDLTILRNGFAAAFASLRDRLLLAVMLIVLGALAARARPSGVEWPIVAAAAITFGASVQLRLARRLDDLAAESPLAADALEVASRRRYQAAWHLIAVAAALAAAMLTGQLRSIPAWPAYAVGVLLAMVWRSLPKPSFASRARPASPAATTATPEAPSAWTAMALSIARRQIGLASEPVRLVAVLAAAALTATIAAALLRHVASRAVADVGFGLIAIGSAFWLSRVDHAVVRFAAFAGHGPAASVAAHASGGAIAGLLSAGAAALVDTRLAVLASLVFAGALTLLVLRVLAYRLHPKRNADLMLTLAFGVAGLIGSAAPFLLPLMLVASGLALARRSRSATWSHP